MKLVRSPQDLGASMLFLAVGVAGLILGAGLPGVQRGGEPGSGTMPYILSLMCLGFAFIMLVRAVRVPGPAIAAVPWRALALVLVSVAAFAALVETAGYVATAIVTPVLAMLAWRGITGRDLVLIGLSLGLGASLLFIVLLRQPLDPW